MMLVRYYWPDCTYRGKEWGARPVDAFWVEATAEEAEAAVFAWLRSEQVEESRALGEMGRKMAGQLGDPARPFCSLVARDLSTIDPHVVHYPFHQLWNAGSPFVSMPRRIARLEELGDLMFRREERGHDGREGGSRDGSNTDNGPGPAGSLSWREVRASREYRSQSPGSWAAEGRVVEKVVVAKLGMEGGGATILGARIDGAWSFWQEGSSISLDANDDEEWRYWISERSRDLSAVVPEDWPLMYPVELHPEFVGWFRASYEAARAGLRSDLRASQARNRDGDWQRAFAGTRGS